MERKITVVKRFTFESCHHLIKYQGACERPHGHSYKMEVAVEGTPDERGLVVDFKDLKALVNNAIIQYVDHYDLNTVMPKYFDLQGNTTCENMIVCFWNTLERALYDKFGPRVKLKFLKLWETEDSYAYLEA